MRAAVLQSMGPCQRQRMRNDAQQRGGLSASLMRTIGSQCYGLARPPADLEGALFFLWLIVDCLVCQGWRRVYVCHGALDMPLISERP